MPHPFRRLSLMAALALGAQFYASAQVPSQNRAADSANSEIVIEGMRERERQIERFVDALTEAPVMGHLGRFDWKVCPAVVGLTSAQNAAVAERMRRVAQAADIPLAEPDCAPNALVIATPDKQATLRRLRREYPNYFIDPLDRGRRVPNDPGPATAWQVEGLLDADGVPAPYDVINQNYLVPAREASRIVSNSRPHFLASVLVVQLDALAGLTTTQVADYAAMRVFARTDPARLAQSAAPTILTILDAPMDREVPVTLTHWDLGFLRALYRTPENRFASQQRREIRRRLRDDLAVVQEDGTD